MKRNKSNKGFTLAELLVVVGIIAVLVAISIPVFTSQLHKAKVATDWANLRALYAEIQTEYIINSEDWDFLSEYSVSGGAVASTGSVINCPDGSKIELEAGTVMFMNDKNAKNYSESYEYIFIYTCDDANSDGTSHQLIITNEGIQTGY